MKEKKSVISSYIFSYLLEPCIDVWRFLKIFQKNKNWQNVFKKVIGLASNFLQYLKFHTTKKGWSSSFGRFGKRKNCCTKMVIRSLHWLLGRWTRFFLRKLKLVKRHESLIHSIDENMKSPLDGTEFSPIGWTYIGMSHRLNEWITNENIHISGVECMSK